MSAPIIVVTGANGLIGNAVRIALEAQGRIVLPLDRAYATEEGRPITFCDVTDIHRLHAVVHGKTLDGIVHCGAYSGPMVERDNPSALVRVNIDGTANMLELARIHGIRRFVFCSSTSAYGPTPPGLLTEDAPMVSSNVYGASKVAGEHLVQAYRQQHGVDGVSLRLSWVYGPRRSTDCVIRTMITDAQEGRPTRLGFGADFHRQYIHVDDAAAALLAALDAPSLPAAAYNITGGTYLTLGEVGEIVRQTIPSADIEVLPGPDPVDDVQSRFDISAAARDLGYVPRHSLESGIQSYAAWLSSRRNPQKTEEKL